MLKKLFKFGGILLIIAIVIIIYLVSAPTDFNETNIVIEKGTSLSKATEILEEKRVVKYAPLLQAYTTLMYDDPLQAGVYHFGSKESLMTIARRITQGKYDIEQQVLLIQEGSTNVDIAEKAVALDTTFNTKDFLSLASSSEGYLFPDSYVFIKGTTPNELYATLRAQFESKTTDLKAEANRRDKNWSDVIIMASLLEGEAQSPEDMKLVAGIFYNRLKAGIPLQSDAPFRKINGKTTKDLTLADLQINSPYNTYRNKGLTPTPISNPGLVAIDAAIHPTASLYMYFLTDKEGIMHYADTFDEHIRNKNKYLK